MLMTQHWSTDSDVELANEFENVKQWVLNFWKTKVNYLKIHKITSTASTPPNSN